MHQAEKYHCKHTLKHNLKIFKHLLLLGIYQMVRILGRVCLVLWSVFLQPKMNIFKILKNFFLSLKIKKKMNVFLYIILLLV